MENGNIYNEPADSNMLMFIQSKTIVQNGKHGLQSLTNDAELFTLLLADDLLISDTVFGLQNHDNVFSSSRHTEEKMRTC